MFAEVLDKGEHACYVHTVSMRDGLCVEECTEEGSARACWDVVLRLVWS